MATSFPSGLDSFTNPTAVDTLDSPPHDTQHADANDAIEALQAKVGVDSSAVTTSLDYRVAQLETGGGGMTVSSTAPSSPAEGDMWYDDTSGRTYVYYDDGSSQQWVEFGAPPSGIGKILQVVSTTKTDTFTTTSSSYVDITGLSVTITPSATSSKVFLIATFGAIDGAGQNHIQFERNGTPIGNGAAAGSRTTAAIAVTEGTTNYPDSAAWTYLDSPASVSALTYQAQAKRTGGTLCINRLGTDADSADYARTSSTLTAVEVAL